MDDLFIGLISVVLEILGEAGIEIAGELVTALWCGSVGEY
jgi:hypothetical protein